MTWTYWLMFSAGILTGLALSSLALAAFWHRWRTKNLKIVLTQMADTERKLMKTKRFVAMCDTSLLLAITRAGKFDDEDMSLLKRARTAIQLWREETK